VREYSLTNLLLSAIVLGARAGLGLVLAAVIGCDHQASAGMSDLEQFERRKAAEGGVRVFERIPRPEGIVVNGRFEVCAALLPRKIISYCDVADGKGVTRYRMLEGHAACAGARAAFERSGGNVFYVGQIPAIAFDICMSEETRAVSDAPVELRFKGFHSPHDTPEPGMPVFTSKTWSIRRGEVLARDSAAPRLLASAEAVSVWIAVPFAVRPDVGHDGIGLRRVTREHSYGDNVERVLLKEMFGINPDDRLPEPADAIQRLVGNLGEGKRLRRKAASALKDRLWAQRGDGASRFDPAWLPRIIKAAEIELADTTGDGGDEARTLIEIIGYFGPKAKAAKPVVMAALERRDVRSLRWHALNTGLAVGLFAQGDIPRLQAIAERGNEPEQRLAEEALRALGAAPPR